MNFGPLSREHKFSTVNILHTWLSKRDKIWQQWGPEQKLLTLTPRIWCLIRGLAIPCGDMHQSFTDAVVKTSVKFVNTILCYDLRGRLYVLNNISIDVLLGLLLMGGWWRWALVSPVGVSASVNLPLHHKSRSSLLPPAHPGGPGKRAVKRLCV